VKVLAKRKLCINKDVVVRNPLTPIVSMEDITWNLKNKVVEVQQSSGDLQSIIIVEENANLVPKSCSKFVKTPQRPNREKQFLKLLEDFVVVVDYTNMANCF
jgi:nitrogen fixation/metabolism regulation signal transduction histidine kinase